MKISIIVPVYNAGKYLNNCIQSLIGQTYKDIEIILVDDGSTDGSAELCDIWAARDGRIKVVHKKNGGASSARNSGLDNASGEFIGFVDGDDYVDLDMYEKLLDLIVENHADASSCGMIRESENGYKEIWGDDNAPIEVLGRSELLKLIGEANGILPVSQCNKLYSKNVIQNIRFNTDLKYAEDVLFNFDVAENIKIMVIQNIPRYHYVNNSDSVSHIKFNAARFDEHRVMDILFNRVKENPDIYQYCIKGDVLKSFRTIKEMCLSGNCVDRFHEIRNRIILHKEDIYRNDIYSKETKIKTFLLYNFPQFYKVIIKAYASRSLKKQKKVEEKKNGSD